MSWRGMLKKAGIEANTLKREIVLITNAQIKALRATPKTLIPAPGTGRFIELVSAILVLNAGTNVLSESTANLVIQYHTSGRDATGAIETTGFIDQAVDQVALIHGVDIATAPLSEVVNKALELFNTGAGEIAGNAAGDATMTVIVNYRIHDDTV